MAISSSTQHAAKFGSYAFQFLSFFSAQPNPVAVAEEVLDVFLEPDHPLRRRPCVEHDGDDPRGRLRLFGAKRDAFAECFGVDCAHGQLAENVWRLLQAVDMESAASPLRRALDAAAAAEWHPLEVIRSEDLRRRLESLGRAVQFALAGFTGREKVLRKQLEAERGQLQESGPALKGISISARGLLEAFYSGSVERGVLEWHRLQSVCDRAGLPKSTGNKVAQQLENRDWIERSDAAGHSTLWKLTAAGAAKIRELRREPVSMPSRKQDAGRTATSKSRRSKRLR